MMLMWCILYFMVMSLLYFVVLCQRSVLLFLTLRVAFPFFPFFIIAGFSLFWNAIQTEVISEVFPDCVHLNESFASNEGHVLYWQWNQSSTLQRFKHFDRNSCHSFHLPLKKTFQYQPASWESRQQTTVKFECTLNSAWVWEVNLKWTWSCCESELSGLCLCAHGCMAGLTEHEYVCRLFLMFREHKCRRSSKAGGTDRRRFTTDFSHAILH